MALSAEESSTMLPVRPVYIRNRRSSQTMRTGVGMPTYTIQKDAPWMQDARDSVVSSTNSDEDLHSDFDSGQQTSSSVNGAGSSYQVSCHATAHDNVTDHGPQARTARMPIFKQVRNILQKPSSESLAFNVHSDDMSETDKPGQVKPNTYVSPWDAAFKTRRKSPERKQPPKLTKRASLTGLKALSQPNIQKSEEEVKPTPPLKAGRCSPRVVSPVSSSHSNQAPSVISANLRTQPKNILETLNIGKQLKRKPAPGSRAVSQSENMPPSPQLDHSQSAKSEWGDTFEEDVHRTYSNLNSAATDASAGNSPHLLQAEDPQSRFSWSTVATQPQPPYQPSQQTPQQAIHPAFRTQKDKPASVPAQPTGYPSSNHTQETYQTERGPPVQSILSRHRPIQRLDREDSPRRNPPRLKVEGTTSTRSASTPPKPNPTHTKTRAPTHQQQQQDLLNPNTPNKALPLPPTLAAPAPHFTHLEHLLVREQDLLHQRRNVHKTIHDLEQVERASPMEVSFATVREAKRKLAELRARLEEVGLEEREVGIAISRARRREEAEAGEGGGLWVRRVTG
ncbi:hypothetical protein D0869_12828 [Hortaea werneckii]|uniref:Uncharacterized protein n=1 Tax=Hortaea werneckii TaxID=91943 RepID=A0A3M6W6L0_HORWE|nr:hypothetical protein KC316_g12626 [Hortaea werneckii]RMX74204.1 hypothetical protein D0869_12828 [Hortaea werneckii]